MSGARPSVSFRAVDAEAVARVLASAPVFSALSETERSDLVAHLHARRFARDEVVFHRDDAAGHVYVILSGSVKVAIPDEEGHEIVVAVEREGERIGGLPGVVGQEREARGQVPRRSGADPRTAPAD